MHYTDSDGVRRCPFCKQPEKHWEFLAERPIDGDPYYGEAPYTEFHYRCRRCGRHFHVED